MLTGLTTPGKFSFLAPPQQPDEIGRLGPYRVLGVLGAGGMGVVFRAEDPALRRQIALKVMLTQTESDHISKDRFLREARSQAAVDHEHIVAIHQIGEEGGMPFIAMPLLKGLSLGDALQANPNMPLSEAIRIAREIAEGLAAAHGANLVHRDITPPNIWLEGKRRRVKILDFGLARGEHDSDCGERPTKPGLVIGTPAHMSPEQAQGEPLDARTDLFSMGVLLYQMLTGRQPFTGKNPAATLLAVVSRTPVRPAVVNPQVPPALDALTMRLLEKDAADRPTSAEAVADELRAIERVMNRTHDTMLASAATTAAVTTTSPWASPTVGFDSEVIDLAHCSDASDVREPTGESTSNSLSCRARMWIALVVPLVLITLTLILGQPKVNENAEPVLKFHDDSMMLVPTERKNETRTGITDDGRHEEEAMPELQRRLEPALLSASLAQPFTPEAAPVPRVSDRLAAQWVLELGGVVRVNDQGSDVKAVASLPQEPFRLTYVWLRNTQADDLGLAILKDCNYLAYLNLSNTCVTDVGLAHFADCRTLTALNLSNTSVTERGLANFRECKLLTALNLGTTSVSDAGLSHFADCRGLTYLNLGNTPVSDAGFANFKQCHGLTYVGLGQTNVSDAALTQLKECKNLSVLEVQNTRVTPGKIQDIKKALPQCRVVASAVESKRK